MAENEKLIEQRCCELLKARGMTFAAAESCTGGLIAKRITDVPGASLVFMGGVVSYTDTVKHRVLGVPAEMLEEYGLEYDFLELPVAAVPILRNAYRLVHIVELLDNDRCTVKASMGSSSFSTAQMTAFIDGIFDRLAEMGVNDPNVTAYWQEWQEVPR